MNVRKNKVMVFEKVREANIIFVKPERVRTGSTTECKLLVKSERSNTEIGKKSRKSASRNNLEMKEA